jgi:hypothetical protein
MEQAGAYYLFLLMALLLPPLLLLVKLKKQRGADDDDERKIMLPPGPWRLPVIGSLHHLLGKPLADLARRSCTSSWARCPWWWPRPRLRRARSCGRTTPRSPRGRRAPPCGS